jgi:hypothetical protein
LAGYCEEEYKAYITTQYPTKNVSFLGFLEHDKAMELLSQAAFLVLPSYTEGFPNVVIEAMMCKKPVIATDVGAIKVAVSTLEKGKVVTIFPQGHRCPGVNPATTPVRNGAALIAYHAKCDVIPVTIDMRGAKYGLFKRTRVVFGKPMSYEDLGFSSGGRDEYARATDMIFAEVVKNGNFSSLPEYTPERDRANKKKKRKK